MQNLEQAISEINKNLSVCPEQIVTDSKIHRFGLDKECWYAAHEWDYKGNNYYSVTYASWKQGIEHHWKSYNKKQAADKNFLRAYTKKTEDSKIQLKRDKENAAAECIRKWRPIFENAKNQSFHEYIDYKKIESFNTRVDSRGTLLIPMYDHEKFVGVQMIWHQNDKFEKRFSKGVKMQGSICPLSSYDGLKNSEYVFLSEGFSTAASIQMAFPEIPSVCGFNAGNLIHAINTIRFRNPECKIIIAADRDANKIGEFSAKKCLKHYTDVIYKLPEFQENSPSEWTDFNDLHNFHSLSILKKQLEIKFDDFFKVRFLGTSLNKKSFFYTSTDNKSVVEITAKDHLTKPIMYSLAPKSWYLKKYPKKNADSETIGVNWDNMANEFIQKNKKIGFWNRDNEKGLGIWRDGKHFIFNDGRQIKPNIKNPRYFYIPELGDYDVDLNHQATIADMQIIKEVFSKLSLKNKESVIYLLAWIVQSNILTVLPWKFHIWITGETNSGKSWIQDLLKDIVYNCKKFDNSSMAGMQSKIGKNATPFVFDESEPTKTGILSLLQFAREASNPEGAKKIRSNSSQEIIEATYHCTIAFGSIQLPKFEAQDWNRFFIIETVTREKSGQTYEDFALIEEAANIIKEGKNTLFARCYNRIPNILENQKIVSSYLRKTRSFKLTRTTMQLSILIACFYEYVSEEVINGDEIEAIMSEFNLDQSDYVKVSEVDQAQECLDALMSMEIDSYDQRTLSHCIDHLKQNPNNEIHERMLAAHGIRLINQDELFIHTKSRKIKIKLKEFSDYANILKRSNKICVKARDVQRIKGYHQKPVCGVRVRF